MGKHRKDFKYSKTWDRLKQGIDTILVEGGVNPLCGFESGLIVVWISLVFFP